MSIASNSPSRPPGPKDCKHDLTTLRSVDNDLDAALEHDGDSVAVIALNEDWRTPPIPAGTTEIKQRRAVCRI